MKYALVSVGLVVRVPVTDQEYEAIDRQTDEAVDVEIDILDRAYAAEPDEMDPRYEIVGWDED